MRRLIELDGETVPEPSVAAVRRPSIENPAPPPRSERYPPLPSRNMLTTDYSNAPRCAICGVFSPGLTRFDDPTEGTVNYCGSCLRIRKEELSKGEAFPYRLPDAVRYVPPKTFFVEERALIEFMRGRGILQMNLGVLAFLRQTGIEPEKGYVTFPDYETGDYGVRFL